MRQKSGPEGSAEKHVKDIRRRTRRKLSAQENIPSALEGLRGEYSIAELCRPEAIARALYDAWSKEFLEAGKRRLSGDTRHQATSGEASGPKREMRDLKEVVTYLTQEDRISGKSVTGDGAFEE
jgi:transposase